MIIAEVIFYKMMALRSPPISESYTENKSFMSP